MSLPYDALEATRHLERQDPRMAALIRRVGPLGLRVEAMPDPFESLLASITFQQLAGKAAGTILGRFKASFGERFPTPEEVMATSVEALRALGLSRAKAAAMQDLAAKTLAGVVPSLQELRNLEDREIVERITQVKGVGPWTVEMLLIFRLGRPDVLPATDYGVRKGFARLMKSPELPLPKELVEHGEPWRPFRSVAAWYLWRALELPESEEL